MDDANGIAKWVKVNDGDLPYYYCTDDVDDSDGNSNDETIYVLNIVDEDSAADDSRHDENCSTPDDQLAVPSASEKGSPVKELGQRKSVLDSDDQSSVQVERPVSLSDNTSVIKVEYSTADHTSNGIVNKAIQCRFCGKNFTNAFEFNRHSRVHCGDKPYHCHICGKQFTLNSNLKTHLRTHSGKKPYQCVYCPENFTYLHSLQRHVRIHNNGNFFECRDCNRKFTNNTSLASHLQSHTNLKSAGLLVSKTANNSVTQTTFSKEEGDETNKPDIGDNYREYNKTNSVDLSPRLPNIYSDEKCFEGQVIKTESLSQRNRGSSESVPASSTNEPIIDKMVNNELHEKCKMPNGFYKCPKCEKVTCRKWEFYRHYKKHLGLRPFQCHYCLKTFTLRCNLNTHLRLHTGVKPYHCLQCNEKFMYLRSLQRHIRVHNEEKTLQCGKCNRRFTDPQEYKIHMELHSEKADITIEFNDPVKLDRVLGTGTQTIASQSYSAVPFSTINSILTTSNNSKSCKEPDSSKEVAANMVIPHDLDSYSVSEAEIDTKCTVSTSDCLSGSQTTKGTELHSPVSSRGHSPIQNTQNQGLLGTPEHFVGIKRFPNYTVNDSKQIGMSNFTPTERKYSETRMEDIHKKQLDVNPKGEFPNYTVARPLPVNIVEKNSLSSQLPMNEKENQIQEKNMVINSLASKSDSDMIPVYILDEEENIQEEIKPPTIGNNNTNKLTEFDICPHSDRAISKEEEDSKEYLAKLNDHFKLSVKIENGCFTCQLCGKELWRKSEMQKHLRIHFGIKPFVCTYCTKSFTLNCNLKAHLRLHTGSMPYKCQECGQKFMYIHSLQRHARIHNNGKFFECIACNRRFTGSKEHLEHMMSHKISAGAAKVESHTSHSLSSIGSLPRPVLVYSGADILKKPKCETDDNNVLLPTSSNVGVTENKTTEVLGHFVDHKTNCHKDEDHKSGVTTVLNDSVQKSLSQPCYPDYKTNSFKHINLSSPPSVEKPYECSICSKRFTVKCNLKTHMRLHSGDKPYACTVCPEKFMYLHSLQRHVRVHNSGKFLECRDCNRRFISKEELAQHEAMHMHNLGYRYYNKFSHIGKPEAICDQKEGISNATISKENSCKKEVPYMPNKSSKTEEYSGDRNVSYPSYQHKENGFSDKETNLLKPDNIQFTTQGGESYQDLLTRHLYNTADNKTNSVPSLVTMDKNTSDNLRPVIKEESNDEVLYLPSSESDRHSNKVMDEYSKKVHRSSSESCTTITTTSTSMTFTNSATDNLPHGEENNDLSGTRKEFQCPYCNRILVRKWDFDRHVRKHSGQKPFSCHYCGKCFGLNSSLKAHLRIHTNEQPYHCEECGLKFTYLHSLQRHVRVHNNGHFLECIECNRRFTSKMDYIVHMRCRHSVFVRQAPPSASDVYFCHVSS